ncbi:MAG: hypothetical protein IKE65_08135 [Clostridia bacterium]|nr:hypothetical protein [Clostridia bacterium]
MSSKKGSYKVMPILSIVFFSVSLVLFFLKTVWATAARTVLYGSSSFAHSLIAEGGKSFALSFPAILFIICAALYLKKSSAYRKMSVVAITAQTISCVIIIARLIFANNLLSFPKNAAYLIILCLMYLCIAVLCFIAAIKTIKDKSKRTLLLIAGSIGICIAALMLGYEAYQVAANFAFYGEHTFLLLNKCTSALLYFVSLSFYYTAFIFFATFRKKAIKDADK